ncbi:hypothetical protein M413DRAFT_444237 [Hebeloma cylindrosporum]|uniref:Epoxide hydrolase N-terminal domain-containing protein n=1 Tax=Hebeloma cylindrosporum TaxID=76867 RepID=A0A0C2YQV3_HEBCY|nr:hypothetical protein M413DRAFT_444237 [Hebeloma cylindrosporum h7]
MASTSLPSSEMSFRINIPDDKIAFLYRKLSLPAPLDELLKLGRDYGVPLADLQRLLARWRDGYDWKKYEQELNEELPQFKKDIHVDGFGTLGIHYMHKKSTVTGAIPLLFVHGWTGSVIEVRKILPLLTEGSPSFPSFHVVAFSLPGYGFSEAPRKKGFQISQFAETGHKLMLSLGYEEYVTQGGDVGFFITRRSAKVSEGNKARHFDYARLPESMPPYSLQSPWLYFFNPPAHYTSAEKAGLERTERFMRSKAGYFKNQPSQAQTFETNLTDSPVGLLAWIYGKLLNWSDSYSWEDDEVLTWVSIYWFSTPGPAASLKVYNEMVQASSRAPAKTTIPQGWSYFPREVINMPRS